MLLHVINPYDVSQRVLPLPCLVVSMVVECVLLLITALPNHYDLKGLSMLLVVHRLLLKYVREYSPMLS